MTTIRELAAAYLDQFEVLEREHSSTYKRKDNADDKLQELCYAAHGDMLPDDYKYNYIVDALELIVDADEDTDLNELEFDIEPDVYNSDRLKWLSSNLTRAYYLDDYIEHFGKPEQIDLYELIGFAQVMEKTEVFRSVLSSLTEIVDEIDDEDLLDDEDDE